MLSFGYTVLATVFETFVLRAGLDPLLGAYHQPAYGRPSLALDLMEKFRPILVDSLVLRLVNRKEVSPEDFEDPREEVEAVWAEEPGSCEAESTKAPRAVWLSDTGRRIFFRAWRKRINETIFYPPLAEVHTLESIAQNQVYRLARAIKGIDDYEPFIPR